MPAALEAGGHAVMADPAFTLTGQADRIDRRSDGRYLILDYKTGGAPSAREQASFDKQLLLEAAMLQDGSFRDLPAGPVAAAQFLGLRDGKTVPAPLETEPPEKTWADFRVLIAAYMDPDQGFTARRMLQKDSDVGDYDHLARYGEWDRSADPVKVHLG